MLAGVVVKLDNVFYGSFPTASELIELSSNLVLSFIDFIRTLGVNGREQMAKTFNSPLEDIDRLCLKCRLNPEVEASSIERSIESRKIWQREILGGSTKHFEVNLREILERARARAPFYRIDAIAKEVHYFLDAFLKRINASKCLPKGVINYEKVDEIIANCPLEPIRSWSKARQDFDYVHKLLTVAFPHTPISLVAKYLFTDDHPVPQNITYYCIHHRINRFDTGYKTPMHREEQIAFIKWTGHDVKEFITTQAKKSSYWRRYL